MPRKPTLKTLVDDLIRESHAPFSAEDFLRKVQERWQRKISKSTLTYLKRRLWNHDRLIGIDANDFLPYPAVLKKIEHLPLAVPLTRFELERGLFIPGHRLIPLVQSERAETDLIFLDPEGRPLPKIRESFYLEEIVSFYPYADELHFPDEIQVNEWMLAKSSVRVPVWDLSEFYQAHRCRWGDALAVRLIDYDRGLFEIRPYARTRRIGDRLYSRCLNLALERALLRLWDNGKFQSASLEKQLMLAFFSLDESVLRAPAFSLPEFLDSMEELTTFGIRGGKMQLVPDGGSKTEQRVREDRRRMPRGAKGSLEEIFQDLGLPFTEREFKSILYTVMGTERYKIESVFHLLFGGEGKLFLDRAQHDAFYQQLRQLLYRICDDLKLPESRVVSDLRARTVEVKLSLISILRFLESQSVGLEDLPEELLEQVIDLDAFCKETLSRFAFREEPPDLKFIRDARLALKIILPHLDQLEEEVYYRLGFY